MEVNTFAEWSIATLGTMLCLLGFVSIAYTLYEWFKAPGPERKASPIMLFGVVIIGLGFFILVDVANGLPLDAG